MFNHVHSAALASGASVQKTMTGKTIVISSSLDKLKIEIEPLAGGGPDNRLVVFTSRVHPTFTFDGPDSRGYDVKVTNFTPSTAADIYITSY